MTKTMRERRDERGATTVLVGLLAFVLLGAGAIAVDVGQVYAKRASLQKTADMAVLAAAAELDGTNTCSGAAVDAAESYLVANWIDQAGDPLDAAAVDLGGSSADGDGYMKCTGWEVELWAPTANVRLRLARAVMDEDDADPGVNVPAYAKAGVFSPAGVGVMPAYAVEGCDSGQQTLLDNSPGGTTPLPTPDLREDSPVDAGLTISTLTSQKIDLNATGIVSLSIQGNNKLQDVTNIAFTTPEAGSDIHHEVVPTTSAKGAVTLTDIPADVKATQEVWYVRVSDDGGVTWSNALPFQVGEALLECASSVTDGNFGALKLPHAGENQSNWLATNMGAGLSFDLSTYIPSHANWECFSGDGTAVTAPNDGTNCVDTDTGLPASDTEAGLLTGTGISATPRLAKPTNPECGRPDQSIDFGGSIGTKSFNNDTLDCFVDAGAGTSYQSKEYSGPAVVSTDVFYSPRFFWTPVLGKQTLSGGSNRYQIVDFRPAFLTGPDSPTTDEYNGLGFKSTGSSKTLRSVKVVFFSANALPASMSGGPTTAYLGVGTKVIRLVD